MRPNKCTTCHIYNFSLTLPFRVILQYELFVVLIISTGQTNSWQHIAIDELLNKLFSSLFIHFSLYSAVHFRECHSFVTEWFGFGVLVEKCFCGGDVEISSPYFTVTSFPSRLARYVRILGGLIWLCFPEYIYPRKLTATLTVLRHFDTPN